MSTFFRKPSILLDGIEGREETYTPHDFGVFLLMEVEYCIPSDPAEIERLIKAGAELNVRSATDGVTALGWALHYKEYGIARTLIDAGADVDARDDQGNTALLVAVIWGQLEAIAILLHAGADMHIKNDMDWGPLDAVDASRSPAIHKMLKDFEAAADQNRFRKIREEAERAKSDFMKRFEDAASRGIPTEEDVRTPPPVRPKKTRDPHAP